MTTRTASGASDAETAFAAGREAVTRAASALGSDVAAVGFLFVGPRHALPEVVRGATEASPSTRFVATHTAGEFTDTTLRHGSVACLLVTSDRATFLVRAATAGATSADAADALCADFSEGYQQATRRGHGYSTTALLVNAGGATGEALVKDLRTRTRPFQQVVGGVAADDGAFRTTQVLGAGQTEAGSAAAVHVFDSINWGIGVDHGFSAASKRYVVTKAKENRLYELDGRPAVDVYREFAAARGIDAEVTSTAPFLLGHGLGLYLFDQVTHVRAPFAIGRGGDLRLVGSITEGAQVAILEASDASLIESTARAATAAKEALNGAPVAGVLVFDCYCRGVLLRESFGQALSALRSVFPTEPMAGFLTYGEIARFKGRLDGWHNATTVVAAIPA